MLGCSSLFTMVGVVVIETIVDHLDPARLVIDFFSGYMAKDESNERGFARGMENYSRGFRLPLHLPWATDGCVDTQLDTNNRVFYRPDESQLRCNGSAITHGVSSTYVL
jgi:hypothetical protein